MDARGSKVRPCPSRVRYTRNVPRDADVIVIGGGPAGSTAATMLAREGWRVLLFERERFPREHIGESLLPASLPVLEALGVLSAIEAEGFLKKWGATMVWGNDATPWSWHFRETNRSHPHAYQVWRPRFDQILLENSAANGVDVRQGHRVLEVELTGLDRMAVRYTDAEGTAGRASCRFVVDASGQTGLIGRALGLRHADEQFQNLAVYGYFEGCERIPAPDENNIFIESYEHGWFWLIPLHNGQMSVGAVVDHRFGSEGIREDGLEAFLRRQIAAAPNASRMLRAASLVSGPVVIRDWSYTSDHVAGDGWALAGDAACFIDPLFSTGVHLALSAGVLTAAYATTALKDADLARAAAPVFRDLYYSQYNLFRQLARLFYSTNRTIDSYFWEARRIIGADESLEPRSAFIRAVAGQPARGYERVVLERGDIPSALTRGVEELGAERLARRAAFDAMMQQPGASGSAVLEAQPVAESGAAVARAPVLAEGEFKWGNVLTSSSRPEGTAVSGLVAQLVLRCDGTHTVSAIVDELAALAGSTRAALTGTVLSALGILYVDWVIAL